MKKAVGTELTLENIAHVLELLAEMPDRLEGLVKDARDPRVRQPLRPGERSFVETLAHLIHCEDRTSEAIYLALLVNEPLLPEVHPERQWGKLVRYDLLDFSDLLDYFKLRRAVLLRVLRSRKLPVRSITRSCANSSLRSWNEKLPHNPCDERSLNG